MTTHDRDGESAHDDPAPRTTPASGHGCTYDDHDLSRQRDELDVRMMLIRHKIVVLSGKGGVGKSTVAVNLAVALADAGRRVGLLDVDLHGPSVPTLLGLSYMPRPGRAGGIAPTQVADNLWAMSMQFFLADEHDAVIWRGPRKYSMIRELLGSVDWGHLDCLVVDGLVAFREEYRGEFWLEILLLGGVTAVRSEVERLAAIATRIAPDRVQLTTAVRPPAESFVEPVATGILHDFAELFTPTAEVVGGGASSDGAGGATSAEGRARPVTHHGRVFYAPTFDDRDNDTRREP
jgi:hypothetical protein